MTHRVFVLHRVDLQPALQLAAQLQRDGLCDEPPVITLIDPVLHTHACLNGAPGARLLQVPGSDIAVGATCRALADTRVLCGEIDRVLARLIPEALGAAWCAFWLRTLHTTAHGCRQTGQAMAGLLAGDTAHLLLPDAPQRYGLHSFLPALMYAEGLRAAGQAPRLYRSPLPPWEPTLLPDPMVDARPAGSERPVDLLCHLPTCFSDGALFADQVQATGLTVQVLPSQVYDIDTEGLPRCAMSTTDTLAARLPAARQQALAAVLDEVSALLTRHLDPLIASPGMAQRQVLALVEAYRQNALLFFALDERFGAQPPKTLLISNHDAGLHGAHLSFAWRHGLRVVMVPHAKIFNSVVPSYGHDMLCLTHPLQAGEVIDMDGSRMPTGTLDFAKPLRLAPLPTRPLATLGIVLNGVSASATCLLDLQVYVAGLRELLDWCRAQQVACRIRCRPSENTSIWLGPALGLDIATLMAGQEGTLADFAQPCDLVLGYDVPTSGLFDLLDQGQPVLQALCRRLAPEEARIVDARIVPHLPLADALARLTSFCAQASSLWDFAQRQRREHAQAMLAAQPLRAWL